MERENAVEVVVVWRGKQLMVGVNRESKVGDFGKKLLELTNVKADTMRLFVPQAAKKSSAMINPFAEEYSGLSLQEMSLLEGKPIRMMGAFDVEIEEVSHNNMTPDLRIAGFEEEEKRLRQRLVNGSQASLKLPTGTYIFCDFRTLDIPGIKLSPPASEALRRMHMLACDPGINAIMNKHRWCVGVMTEMAPVGYVGITPKCLLGYNKNHGEEISLRLRTDDLKGFRKYESIKKTLLHELAHMVFSEHDADFFALDKQLNQEAASLDWTKSRSRTLSGHRIADNYGEDIYLGSSSNYTGQKIGGTSDQLATARASSVAAAYRRFLNKDHTSKTLVDTELTDTKMRDSQEHISDEPRPDDVLAIKKGDTIAYVGMDLSYPMHKIDIEPDPDDNLDDEKMLEPDPDDSPSHFGEVSINECDPYEPKVTEVRKFALEPDPDDSVLREVNLNGQVSMGLTLDQNQTVEKDQVSVVLNPGDFGTARIVVDEAHRPASCNYEPDPDDCVRKGVTEAVDRAELDSDSSHVVSVVETEPDSAAHICGLDNQEIQRIEEPVTVICTRLQKSIGALRKEITPEEVNSVLKTLCKIVGNVIEHPYETKFRRLRKANPLFQRNVVSYKEAMEVLTMIGFCEEVVSDEVGRTESYLVLKRNDPGLLWLAKASLEVAMA